MFNNLRLRTKMLVFFLFPTLLILTAISYISYRTALNALDESVRTSLKWQTESSNDQIEIWLESRAAIVSSASTIIASDAAGTDLRSLLASLKQSSDGVTNVFIGFADGRYQDAAGWSPPNGYDPRTRDWYKTASGANAIVYSEVYIDQSTNQPTISVLTPVKRNGQVIGVVGADLNISKVAVIAKEAKSGQTEVNPV